MKPATAFQSHPINHLDFRNGPQFMKSGIDSWCSLILSTYKQKSQHEVQEKSSIFITLDGTHGADFDKLLAKLQQTCEQEGITFSCDSTSDYVKPEAELRAEMAPYLTDNRAFGYKATDVRPIQYFQQDARSALKKVRLNLTRCAAYTYCTDPALRCLKAGPPTFVSTPITPAKTSSGVMPSIWAASAWASPTTRLRLTRIVYFSNGPSGRLTVVTG